MKNFDVFLNFDGDCRAAIEFYAGVFGAEIPTHIMTYDQNPDGAWAGNEGRILYASLPIFGCNVMFSDCPAGSNYVKGANIDLALGAPDASEIRKIFDALAEGGAVVMPLGKTFFSEFFGTVTDKFGVTWQLYQDAKKGFDVFLNFDGDCRAALDFYAGVFGLEIPTDIMLYEQGPECEFGKENNGRILHASLPLFGCNAMFSDCPAGSNYVKGTNIALTLGASSADEIKNIFAALENGGKIAMPLGKTFFSELYGMLIDKFGITWQLTLSQEASAF